MLLARGLKLSMACTTLGPRHQLLSSGSVGGSVRFSASGPTAGSHCSMSSLKPHCLRKGSSWERM